MPHFGFHLVFFVFIFGFQECNWGCLTSHASFWVSSCEFAFILVMSIIGNPNKRILFLLDQIIAPLLTPKVQSKQALKVPLAKKMCVSQEEDGFT